MRTIASPSTRWKFFDGFNQVGQQKHGRAVPGGSTEPENRLLPVVNAGLGQSIGAESVVQIPPQHLDLVQFGRLFAVARSNQEADRGSGQRPRS